MSRVRLEIRFWSSILVCLLMSPCVHAETVILVDGDTIRGQITQKTDASIILVHRVLGELDIPKDQIASIRVVHDVLGEIEIPPDQILSPAAGKPEVETVVVTGGDTIRGKIAQRTNTSIVLVHAVLGEFEIPIDQIESITVGHDVLGEITIPKDRILSLVAVAPEAETPEVGKPAAKQPPQKQAEDIKGEEIPAAAPVTQQDQQQVEITKSPEMPAYDMPAPVTVEVEEPKPEPAAAPDESQAQRQTKEEGAWFEPEFERLNAWAARRKKTGWSAALDFSLDTTTGNTAEETTRLGAHIKRRLRDERLAIDASYYHKTSEGDVTDNKFTSGIVQDWLNPGSRWFFFTLGRFDYDEFESWQKRANAQVGPGYNLIGTDDMVLNLRVGPGSRKEWGSENNDTKFEGLAGFDFVWKITDRQSFDTTFHYYPVITDFDDYRTRATINWRYLLSKEVNVSLLLGVLNEFQSVVDPGLDDTDTRVFVGIQMSFE